MDFQPSTRAVDLRDRVLTFIAGEIAPVEELYHPDVAALRRSSGDPWTPLPVLAQLRAKAKGDGLWNLFLPEQHAGDYAARFGTHGGRGLTNVDYAPIAETTGRSQLTPYVFNCNAPDSENMEVLLRYGTDEQRRVGSSRSLRVGFSARGSEGHAPGVARHGRWDHSFASLMRYSPLA